MKTLSLLLIVAGLAACQSGDKKAAGTLSDTSKVRSDSKEDIEKAKKASADTANATTIQWLDALPLDLGKLKQNKEVEVSFRFKNTGDKNLIIENVGASCGCTVPETPKEPFAPGQEGVIKAKYNGSGSGKIEKHVTVTANTKPSKNHELVFTGDVSDK